MPREDSLDSRTMTLAGPSQGTSTVIDNNPLHQ